jgi:hypothetical protein
MVLYKTSGTKLLNWRSKLRQRISLTHNIFKPTKLFMKKAKSMLLIILVLSTAGGILAFKAKSIGNSKYCFSITDVEPCFFECTFTIQNRQARPVFGGEDMVYYTTTTDLSNCGILDCPFTGIPDQQ